jgi:hypothetical protein
MSQNVEIHENSPFNWSTEQKNRLYNKYLDPTSFHAKFHRRIIKSFDEWYNSTCEHWMLEQSLFRDDEGVQYQLSHDYLEDGIVQVDRFVDGIFDYTYEDMDLTWDDGTPLNFRNATELTRWIKTASNSPLLQDRLRATEMQE